MWVKIRCQCRRGIFFVLKKCNALFSGVGDAAFFETSQFNWISVREENTTIILEEFQAVIRAESLPNIQDISPEQCVLTSDHKWKIFGLYLYGHAMVDNCKKCPQTVALLGTIPGLSSAFISVLSPHKRVPTHRGIYNGILRYHLGLQIPVNTGQCGIKVGQEVRYWQQGHSLVFNENYEHEAWNDSDATRAILIVDFERPLFWPFNILNRWAMTYIARTTFVTVPLENIKTYG